jgi:hypothetical protein
MQIAAMPVTSRGIDLGSNFLYVKAAFGLPTSETTLAPGFPKS